MLPTPTLSAWDIKFLGLARFVATWSKDPSTKVGAVAVGETPNLISVGYNGHPPGVADTHERLCNREVKVKTVLHAETNALLNAQFRPVRLYCTHPPCIRCAAQILAYRSVEQVITFAPTEDFLSRWGQDFLESKGLLAEAGVLFNTVSVQ